MRDAHHLEQLLHRAILAVAAVQGDERNLGLGCGESIDEVTPDIDSHHRVAQTLERVLDPRARAQGDLTLERSSALQYGDTAHSGAPIPFVLSGRACEGA
jgi:hypothetical protein